MPAFGLMAFITFCACGIAVRFDSMLMAVLGTLGGFLFRCRRQRIEQAAFVVGTGRPRRPDRDTLVKAEWPFDILDLPTHLFGNLCRRRLRFAGIAEPTGSSSNGVYFLDDMYGQPNGTCLVHDPALDRLSNPPCRIGGKAEASLGIELLHRMHQPEIAFLDQVQQRQATVRRFDSIMRCLADSSPSRIRLAYFFSSSAVSSFETPISLRYSEVAS